MHREPFRFVFVSDDLLHRKGRVIVLMLTWLLLSTVILHTHGHIPFLGPSTRTAHHLTSPETIGLWLLPSFVSTTITIFRPLTFVRSSSSPTCDLAVSNPRPRPHREASAGPDAYARDQQLSLRLLHQAPSCPMSREGSLDLLIRLWISPCCFTTLRQAHLDLDR